MYDDELCESAACWTRPLRLIRRGFARWAQAEGGVSWDLLPAVSGVVLAIAAALGGCSAAMSERELQRVAKDWALVVRASQVVPVYPLTEDLQPGDVFLVNLPIQDQHRIYSASGFLPLDQQVARLSAAPAENAAQAATRAAGGEVPGGYEAFYAPSYFEGDYAAVPHPRPEPTSASASGGDGGAASIESMRRFDASRIPAASFPSYTFSVSSGQGIRLAVPVQGVPVGLSLLNTDSATGSLAIRDAYTYALPADDLLRRLHTWHQQPRVRAELARLEDSSTQPLYLRVVNRVYLTGAVNITMQANGSGSAGADVGVPKAVSLASLDDAGDASPTAAVMAYQRARDALNATLNGGSGSDAPSRVGDDGEGGDAEAGSGSTRSEAATEVPLGDAGAEIAGAMGATGALLPGGSVRLAYASDRSVTLSERFPRLLAIGYLGFDVEVLVGGALGPPVSTYYRLERQAEPVSGISIGRYLRDAATDRLRAWRQPGGVVDADRDAALRAWMGRHGLKDGAGDVTMFLFGEHFAALRAQAAADLVP